MAAEDSMGSSLPGNTEKEKLQYLESRSFKEQAVWLLNTNWAALEAEAENLWNYVENCVSLDLQKVGNALDELNAHRFLEMNQETLTVRAMRTQLRASGAIGEQDRPKLVPLCHVLFFKFSLNWRETVSMSLGGDPEELRRAQQALDAATKSLEECRAAQAELEAALAEVKKQEDEYNGKIEDAKKRSEEGGVVSRNRAKAELAQLLAEDPLPLRRAQITLQAAVKRADRATQAAQAAFDEAEALLDRLSKQGGVAHGSVWWMQRELHEQRKYLPSAKGGIAK
jgi:prefoldin subunit 5